MEFKEVQKILNEHNKRMEIMIVKMLKNKRRMVYVNTKNRTSVLKDSQLFVFISLKLYL